MNAITAFSVISGIASILSLLLALVLLLTQKPRRKLLEWQASSNSVPIAFTRSKRTGYKITMAYEREGSPPLPVSGLNQSILRLANFGSDPIMFSDLIPEDPLRIEVKHPRVLDIALEAVTRPAVNFVVEPFTQNGDVATSNLKFKFLDQKDGALITILTTEPPGVDVRLRGSIIGMPQGFVGPKGGGPPTRRNWAMLLLLLLLYAGSISGAAAIFLAVDEFARLWLLLLPIVSLALPLIIFTYVGALTTSSLSWPESIRKPAWAGPSQPGFEVRFGLKRRAP